MTKNVFKITSGTSVLDACKQFVTNRVGSLVVVDNDIPVGILTERDVIESIILVSGDPKTTSVRDIMSPNIKTVHALAHIEKAADVMRENKIKKLPVVLNNEIVGIITETDMSRTIHEFSRAIEDISNLYYESREVLERVIDEWGNMIVSLKSYKELTPEK